MQRHPNVQQSPLLPDTGYIRLWQIVGRPESATRPATVGVIPVSKSTWYAGIATGRFPKPVHLGPNIVAWDVEVIRALIDQLGAK